MNRKEAAKAILRTIGPTQHNHAETYRNGAIVKKVSAPEGWDEEKRKPTSDLEISQPRAGSIDVFSRGGTIDAPHADGTPRHPAILSGHIRNLAERITTRSDRIRNKEDALIADVHDSMRISELLDELDSALLHQQLEGSLRRKR